MSYDPEPRYPVSGGDVEVGYEVLVAECEHRGSRVVALDGPATLAWDDVIAGLGSAFRAASTKLEVLDLRRQVPPWDEIERRTRSAELPGDPVFARIFRGGSPTSSTSFPPPYRPTGG